MLKTLSTGTGTIITLDEARSQCRVNTNADDTWLTEAISEATDYIQQDCGIRFFGDTYLEAFPMFTMPLTLSMYPVTSITNLKVYALNVLVTIDPSLYYVDMPTNSKAEIAFLPTSPIPYHDLRLDAVQVTYTTGLTVPPLAKRAAKMLVETWYANRGAEVDYGIPREVAFGVSNLLRKIDKRGLIG